MTDGEDSILMFEEWLETGDQGLLDAIEEYNHVDCDSTLMLRDWLLERRAECEGQYEVEIPWRPAGADAQTPDTESADEETVALTEALLAGLPDESEIDDSDERSRWLLAQLLDYHRREDKPMWWEYFSRLEKTHEQLIEEDTEAMGGLDPVGEPEPLPPPKQSTRYRLEFPAQEHKIAPGRYFDPFSVRIDEETGELDPFTARGYNVERVLDDEGVIEVVRGNIEERRAAARRADPEATHYRTELQQGGAARTCTRCARPRPRRLRPVQRGPLDPAPGAPRLDGASPTARRCRRGRTTSPAPPRSRSRSTAATCSSRGRPARARPTPARS